MQDTLPDTLRSRISMAALQNEMDAAMKAEPLDGSVLFGIGMKARIIAETNMKDRALFECLLWLLLARAVKDGAGAAEFRFTPAELAFALGHGENAFASTFEVKDDKDGLSVSVKQHADDPAADAALAKPFIRPGTPEELAEAKEDATS